MASLSRTNIPATVAITFLIARNEGFFAFKSPYHIGDIFETGKPHRNRLPGILGRCQPVYSVVTMVLTIKLTAFSIFRARGPFRKQVIKSVMWPIALPLRMIWRPQHSLPPCQHGRHPDQSPARYLPMSHRFFNSQFKALLSSGLGSEPWGNSHPAYAVRY